MLKKTNKENLIKKYKNMNYYNDKQHEHYIGKVKNKKMIIFVDYMLLILYFNHQFLIKLLCNKYLNI